jgi:hypothetical protein
MYPFNYPKTEAEVSKLKTVMSEHLITLEDKFVNFDKFKGLPPFSTLLGKVKEDFSTLHSLEVPIVREQQPQQPQQAQQ